MLYFFRANFTNSSLTKSDNVIILPFGMFAFDSCCIEADNCNDEGSYERLYGTFFHETHQGANDEKGGIGLDNCRNGHDLNMRVTGHFVKSWSKS